MEGPTDIVIFGAHAFPWYPAPDPWLTNTLKVQTQRFSGFKPEILFQTNGSIPFVWRQAFKRTFLLENDLLFDEDVRFGEDTVFQLEVFPHAANFAYMSDALYHYRWCRPGSLMAEVNKDYDVKIEKHLFMIQRICQYWDSHGWFQLYGKEFVAWMLQFIVPDVQRNDILRKEEHKEQLSMVINTFQLEHYILNQRGTVRFYYKQIK